jgi:hypothetical protein
MTRSEQVTMAINEGRMTWAEALEEANETAEPYEQDYENEMTCFLYADGSVSVFAGTDQSVAAYAQK